MNITKIVINMSIPMILSALCLDLILSLPVNAEETRQGVPACRVTSNYDTCNRQPN